MRKRTLQTILLLVMTIMLTACVRDPKSLDKIIKNKEPDFSDIDESIRHLSTEVEDLAIIKYSVKRVKEEVAFEIKVAMEAIETPNYQSEDEDMEVGGIKVAQWHEGSMVNFFWQEDDLHFHLKGDMVRPLDLDKYRLIIEKTIDTFK